MEKYFEAEEIELVRSGKNYFEVLDLIISAAQEIIHFQTYIFENDETGKKVLSSLMSAAARGVKVYLMVDAIGSFPFPSKTQNDLSEAGVHFRLFSPILSGENIFIGRRLHHKIVVADRYHGLIGGINIADKYNSVESSAPWLDYAVYSKGRVNEHLHLLCEHLYLKRKRDKLKNWERTFSQDFNGNDEHLVRYRSNDFIHRKNEIHRSYREAFIRAEYSLTLVASYFLPGNYFRKLLKKAAARGVNIRIVVAGRSDLWSVRLAENYLYDYYLRHKIEIYEWRTSVMHGKAMIADETWATVGSYNLNFLSKYASIELNADIIDQAFLNKFSAHIEGIIAEHCERIDLEALERSKNPFKQVLRWLSYNIYRLIMNYLMLGSKQRKLQRGNG